MHPLRNGSQAATRPPKKPSTGLAGWFTESGDNNVPSYPGADWFNHVVAEFQAALVSQGVAFDPEKDDNLSKLFEGLRDHIDNSVNDLASTQYVDNTVNGLASTQYVDNTVNGLASTQYVDAEIASIPRLIVEATNQIEEDAAFASGAVAVIRLDLIGPRASLFMNFETPSVFQDLSEFSHTVVKVGTPIITNSVPAPVGSYVADLRGPGNFLYLNDAPSLRITGGDSDGWGMEAYLRLDDTGEPNKFLFSKGVQSNLNNQWYLALVWSAVRGSYDVIFSGSNNTPAFTIPYPYSADLTNFHHISVNSDGVNISLYIDGVLTGSAPELNIYDGGGLLYIGSWIYTVSGTDCGYLDQVTISNDGPLRSSNFTPPTGA